MTSGGGMRKKRERGAYGNKRGKPAVQKTRRENRMADPRVQKALDEARRHNEGLSKSIERGAKQTAVEVVGNLQEMEHEHSKVYLGDPPRYSCCSALVPEEVLRPPQPLKKAPATVRKTRLPKEGDGNGNWTLGQARQVLRAGYTLAHTVKMTGFGTKWFDDIPLDKDGRGIPL